MRPSRIIITAGYPIVVSHPLADLCIQNDQYPDKLVLSGFVRDDPVAEGHLLGGASIGELDLDTDQVRAVRDWCNAWLKLYGELHKCEVPGGWRPYECTETEDGRFWAGEETLTDVNFCPICGMRAPTQRKP